MNVSLPEELKAYVDDQVRSQGFGTTSEFVRELIRRDRDRARLRALLVEGLESPTAVAADKVYFGELRAREQSRREVRPNHGLSGRSQAEGF